MTRAAQILCGPLVAAFWVVAIATGACFALDGIDTIAEQPSQHCPRCCNE